MVNNPGFEVAKTFLGGGSKNFLFSPQKLGKIPILTNIFQTGLVQPPTSFIFHDFLGGSHGGHINWPEVFSAWNPHGLAISVADSAGRATQGRVDCRGSKSVESEKNDPYWDVLFGSQDLKWLVNEL